MTFEHRRRLNPTISVTFQKWLSDKPVHLIAAIDQLYLNVKLPWLSVPLYLCGTNSQQQLSRGALHYREKASDSQSRHVDTMGREKKSSFLTEGNRSRLWKQGHLPRLVGVRGKWREKRGLLKLTSFILSLWLFMCTPECHTMNGFGVRKSESTHQYAHLYYSLHLVYDGRLFALHMWHSGTGFSL